MTSASTPGAAPLPPHVPSRPLQGGVLLLLLIGLLGHLYAAHVIGGSRMAYTHHVLGFVFILAVTGALLWFLGRRLWPAAHPTRTLLVIAAVQAILGVLVALGPAARITHGGG